ncbi:MAG: hypothetical protein R3E66_18640 [bacterium]
MTRHLDAGTQIDATQGRTYSVRASTTDSTFQPRLYAYTPTFGFLDSGTARCAFTASLTGPVFIHLYDVSNLGGATFDF